MADNRPDLSLIGCCAIRDIFGLHGSDGGYRIRRFVQNTSPLSIVTGSPLLRGLTPEDGAVFEGPPHFIARCQRLELEKRVFDYLSEEPSDYLVMDMAEFRRKLFYFPENDGWFSENYNLSYLFDRYRASGLIPEDFQIKDPLLLEQPLREKLLTEYCRKLLSLYPPDRIILVEIKAGGHHEIDDADRCRAEEETAEIFNRRMDYAFSFAKEILKGAHVIRFPENVTLDFGHKWGRNLLHYVREYYDYALEAVNLITDHALGSSEERAVLEEMRTGCGELLKDKYMRDQM